jgi:predicted MFS family arabinose efflux permease
MARRRVFLDVGPLRRSKDFRYLYFGEMVSFVGSGLTTVAVPLQLFRLTHSSLQVGLASLAQLVPLIACSFVGGAVADAYDRRRVLLVAELAMASCSAALAVNATLGSQPQVWPLYVFSAAAAGLSGVESPTRVAAAASVVDRSDLTRMSALWQVLFQMSTVVGPFLAGIVIAAAGLGAAYWADVATFAAAFAGAWLLRPLPPGHQATAMGFKSIKEGLQHLRGERAIQGIYLIDLAAMVFGMPRALFPELGTVLFHGGARTVSYLYTAVGVGALAGALTTGWVAHVRRQGRAVVIAVLVWGASITAFGLVRSLGLGLVCLAVAGWADVLSAIFRNTILQLRVPDELRGRMNAIQTAVVAGGPRLGDLESGGVATLVSPTFAVVSGGLACIAAATIMTLAMPMFWRLRLVVSGAPGAPVDDPTTPHPAAGPSPEEGVGGTVP